MRPWTEAEREIVRCDYRQTDESCQEIADRLGRTFCAVRGKVYALGVQKITGRKPWSPEEEERLAELVRQHPLTKVSRMMHRSIASVTVRANRLHFSRRIRDGWFTKSEVCQILGQDHKWVQRQIDRGGLVASYHNGHRPKRRGLAMWHIAEKDLIRFILGHASELNGRQVNLVAIVMLLRRD